jgi:hypothetical protein
MGDLGLGMGLGLRCDGFREGDDGSPSRFCFQPPAVVQESPGQSRLLKLNGDDLCHGVTMHSGFAARLFVTFRICGLLCRFRADGGSMPALAGGIVGSANRFLTPAHHEILITDEY